MDRRAQLPRPFGWFHLAFSAELKRAEVVAMTCFGHDVVLFRTEAGEAKLLDAFCPHLGAHLGHGGTVAGEAISCPFHGWRFSGDGVCLEVPYARTAPPVVGKRCLRPWPLAEVNRSIFAWFHPRQEAPAFPVVELAELSGDDGEWTELLRKRWKVRCHVQEVQENEVDTAHFRSVHRVDPAFEFQFAAHRSRIVMDSTPAGSGMRSRVVLERNGPGQTWARHEGFPEFLVLNPVTPIDDDYVMINIGVAFRRATAGKLSPIHQKVFGDICAQVEKDVPIFENKVYRAAPLYCDGDGPIREFREWFRQFYA